MKKHAFLIIAYHQWDLLCDTIKILDNKYIDFYIHIDRKISNVPFDKIKSTALYSQVYFVKRIDIHRGTFSIGQVELELVSSAINNEQYDYLHLISGQDLPVKSCEYILSFFDNNKGANYIDLIPPSKMRKNWYERISLYNVFVEQSFDQSGVKALIAKTIKRGITMIQRTLRINRFHKYEKEGFEMCFGSAWFSITSDFARYLLSQKEIIERIYGKYTSIAEESFVQTILWSSPYRDTIYNGIDNDNNCRKNLRYIVWTGNTSPETMNVEYVERALKSNAIFARKFDLNTNIDAIDTVMRKV